MSFNIYQDDAAPIADERNKKIVERFALCLMSPDNIHSILRLWCKFPPMYTTGASITSINGCIPAFTYIIKTILYAPISLILDPSYVELFTGAITMRIPRDILSTSAKRIIAEMETGNTAKFFFGRSLLIGTSSTLRHDTFKYNEELAKHINRDILCKICIFKALMIALDIENGRYYIDMLQIITAALHNIAFVDWPYTYKKNPGSSVPDLNHVTSGLCGLIKLVGDEALFRLLSTILAKRRSTIFENENRHQESRYTGE